MQRHALVVRMAQGPCWKMEEWTCHLTGEINQPRATHLNMLGIPKRSPGRTENNFNSPGLLPIQTVVPDELLQGAHKIPRPQKHSSHSEINKFHLDLFKNWIHVLFMRTSTGANRSSLIRRNCYSQYLVFSFCQSTALPSWSQMPSFRHGPADNFNFLHFMNRK